MSSSPPPLPPGVLYRVDGESLNALIDKYEKSLSANAAEQDRLGKIRQEYSTLKAKLTTLPQKLEYDALVPLCRRALCPGKIIHTNEITCLLGDNWFAECSAEKAVELVNHRKTKIDEKLEGLKKEVDLINNWKQEAERQLVETIGEGTVEIREDYDEEYENRWKVLHRENLRRYHQQNAKKRAEAKNEKVDDDDADLWTRLDELELQEELDDYLEEGNLTENQVETITENLAQLNTNTSQIKIRTSSDAPPATTNGATTVNVVVPPKDKTEKPPPKGRRVKFSADNIVHNISEEISFDSAQKPSNTVPVTFSDDNTVSTYPCFEPIMIRFRHTLASEREDDDDTQASGTEEEDQTHRVVSCPGDIVKVFGPMSVSAISSKVPKSILKPFAPPLVSEKRSRKAQSEKKPTLSFLDEDNDEREDTESATAIAKVVTERVPVITNLQVQSHHEGDDDIVEDVASKPVSLFKMRRQQQQSLGVVVTSTE